MSTTAEKQFDDFATWFESNLNRYPIVDQEKRWQFLVTCIKNLALVNAQLIEDIQKLEQRGRPLYLPSGLHYTGDLTKVG